MNSPLQYLFESSICLALFYSLYWLFLKKETFFKLNRFSLLLSIPVSFILPLLNIPSPFVSRSLLERTHVLAQPAGVQTHSIGITDILWLIFLVGAGLLLVRFLYQLTQLLLLIKKNGFQKYEQVKIVFIENNSAPFSFFNFIFINKSHISERDFQRILAHELAHIRQYHSIDLIAMELLTIVQWFNPFVWPYKKSLKETHEYLADNAVIAQGCSRARYQLLILEQHVGLKLFEMANNFNRSLIKRRITMMTKNKSKRWAKAKVLLIIPLFCFLMLAFADPKTSKNADLTAQNNTQDETTIQEDSKDSAHPLYQEKSEEKEKEELKKKEEIMKKEKSLKEELAKTEDPEKRELIKKKLLQLQRLKEMAPEETALTTKEQELKELFKNTDDPEKRELIKAKLLALKEKELKKEEEAIMLKEEKLEEMLKEEEDAEKRKQIKEKLLKIQEMKKKLKEEKAEVIAAVKEEKVVKVNPDIELNEEWYKKKKELNKMIGETEDPEKKAELKKKLEKMEKIEALKKAEEATKKKESEKKAK